MACQWLAKRNVDHRLRGVSPESAPCAHCRAATFCHGSALQIDGRQMIFLAQEVEVERG